MVRAKMQKKTEPASKAEAVVELDPSPAGETEEVKKSTGRGKRKGKEASNEDSPPKRTLRSNSKPSLVETLDKEDDKKTRKAPSKPKKAGETNGNTENVNGNGVAETKTDNVEAEPATEKGVKGRKKAEKPTPSKTEVVKETEEKSEDTQETKEEAQTNGTSDKKPVKPAATKGKKKADTKTEEVKEPEAISEPTSKEVNESSEEEPKEKEKAATGKGKKKTEKAKEEEVAAKKPKKDATAKAPKAAKNTETAEEPKEDSKPAAGETKKAGAKGKGAKAKEVAIEHCPSVTFSINSKNPRRGSFEIVVITENNEEQIIWSGLKLGPPRKEKFPTDDQLQKMAEKFLSG